MANAPVKKEKVSIKDSLQEIKVYPIPAYRVGKNESNIPRTKDGKIRNVIITLPNVNQGLRSTPVSVSYTDFKADPIGKLKRYPKLAAYTNATEEQLDYIKKLSRRELFELQNS